MITLTLLHPLKSVPVQHWTFQAASAIKIGRSTDNDVVLYSAVVSRHHVEIRQRDSQWEVVSLGSNGTYIEGKRISKAVASDGMIIRLASSGPKIQIRLDSPEYRVKTDVAQRQSSANIHKKETSRETMIN